MLAGTLRGVVSQRLVPTPDGSGRVCVCEILRMTGRARDMILDPEQTGRLREVIAEGEYYGMQTFDQALLRHHQAGRVSMEDALRVASSPHDFKLLVSADGRTSTSMEDLAGMLGSSHRRRPGHAQADRRCRATPERPFADALGAAARRTRLSRAPLQFLKLCARIRLRMASNQTCAVCRTAEIVCGKWTLLVIRDLADGRSRFCELERSLQGISPRTLSLRLRALEEEGILERQTFPEVPPRVEYALTEKGRALVPLIEDMRTYGREWLGGDCADPDEFDERPERREPVVAAA